MEFEREREPLFIRKAHRTLAQFGQGNIGG